MKRRKSSFCRASLSKSHLEREWFFVYVVFFVSSGIYSTFFYVFVYMDLWYSHVPSRSRPLDLKFNGQWWSCYWIQCMSLYCSILCSFFLTSWSFDLVAMMNTAVIRSEPSDLSDGSNIFSLSLCFFTIFSLFTPLFLLSAHLFHLKLFSLFLQKYFVSC